jgi:hypothetical protein
LLIGAPTQISSIIENTPASLIVTMDHGRQVERDWEKELSNYFTS